jgi:outer membrane protein, heavy metal efflux system
MLSRTPRWVTFLALLLNVTLATAETLTEKDVLDRFLQQSPHARELRAQVAATTAELQNRALYPNPSFAYSREGAGYNEFLEAQQQLPLTGRLGFLRKANQAAVGASEAETKFLLWGLRSDVRLAFSTLLQAQEREAILQKSINEITGINRILTEREKEGEGSKFDRLRAERETAELRAEQGVTAAITAQARAALVSLLPRGTGNFQVTGRLVTPLTVSVEDLIERAARARGDYRSQERQIERFQFEQQAAGRLRFPEPTISGGLKRADSPRGGTDNGAVVGLTFSLPLFNRGTTEVTRFQAEGERARARREVIGQQITAQVEGSYQALLIRQRAMETYEKEITSSGVELTRIAQVGYQEGELGVLELLDAYRVTRQSQLRLIELQSAARQAQIELERVVGEELQP